MDYFFPWKPDEAYIGDYPNMGTPQQEFNLDKFDSNLTGRWENGIGAKTPWSKKRESQKVEKKHLVSFFCPVDILILDNMGRRLGVLSDGKHVAEFKPSDGLYWKSDSGEKQWFFELPEDSYRITAPVLVPAHLELSPILEVKITMISGIVQ